MKEVYLYMCEDCGTVVCNKQDHYKAYYANYCSGCKQGSFFKKVVITTEYNLVHPINETRIVFAVEEKKEG